MWEKRRNAGINAIGIMQNNYGEWFLFAGNYVFLQLGNKYLNK